MKNINNPFSNTNLTDNEWNMYFSMMKFPKKFHLFQSYPKENRKYNFECIDIEMHDYEIFLDFRWFVKSYSSFMKREFDLRQMKRFIIPRIFNLAIRNIFGTKYYEYFYNYSEDERYGCGWVTKKEWKDRLKYDSNNMYNIELYWTKYEYNGWLFR